MIYDYKRALDRLDYIYSSLSKAPIDEYVVALLAAHICVIQSGILENIVKEIMGAYVEKRSSVEVTNYVKIRLRDLQNPRTDRIEEVIGAFSSEWRSKLSKFWEESEIKEHINSIVANRNQISHGRTTSVTISQTKDWIKSIRIFAEFAEKTFT